MDALILASFIAMFVAFAIGAAIPVLPYLLIGGTTAQTLPAGFPGLVTPLGTYWGQLAAVSVVVSIPVLLLVWMVQRHLARGLTFGAVR